jgi:hypothetical protein
MPELTITSTYVLSTDDSNTFTMGNPMPESTLTLCQNQFYPPFRVFGFGLRLLDRCLDVVNGFSSISDILVALNSVEFSFIPLRRSEKSSINN